LYTVSIFSDYLIHRSDVAMNLHSKNNVTIFKLTGLLSGILTIPEAAEQEINLIL